jgi:hypothetical protein
MVLTKGFICTHSIFLYISKKTLDNETYSFKLNFYFFKLPAAFICGVRVKKLDEKECVATVKHRWINQNPFNSMYFGSGNGCGTFNRSFSDVSNSKVVKNIDVSG